MKAGEGNHTHNDQASKLDQGERGRKQFASRFVRNNEVSSAHKAAQEPHDQQVGGPGRVEWDVVVQDVISHMGKGHDKAVDHLQAQQQQGYRKNSTQPFVIDISYGSPSSLSLSGAELGDAGVDLALLHFREE